MKNCKNKISNTCAEPLYGQCVNYETELPQWSEIIDCPNIELTTEELYSKVSEILEDSNLVELGGEGSCITYSTKKIKDVLLAQEQKICELQDRIEILETTAIGDMLIEGMGLDLQCLQPNPCSDEILTIKDLLQSIITKICD